MKLYSYSGLCLFLFITHSAMCLDDTKIFIVSIPKCGTHLLIKLVEMLTSLPGHNCAEICQKFSVASEAGCLSAQQIISLYGLERGFYWDHIPYSEALSDGFKKYPIKILFIYRDPRDQLVSWLYHLYRSSWMYYTPLKKLTYSQALAKFLKEDVWSWRASSLMGMYQSFMLWKQEPHVYAVRFEDLIGPCGGGDLELQYDQIGSIANFLGIDISDEQIIVVAKELFGSASINFRQGKIGSWRDEFSSSDVIRFKQIAGDLLIELGYERDLNW